MSHSRADQQTPQALAAYHKAELDKWWPIIKSAGIKAASDFLFACDEEELIVRRLAFAGGDGGQAAHAGHQRAEKQRAQTVRGRPADIDSARAMLIDTAVAAMIRQTAIATVAISSIPSVVFSLIFFGNGDAKPTFPVSSVMAVILRELVVLRCRKVACD